MTPDELVDAACPTIRDVGWAFYFVPETLARAGELGLDGFRFYFLGRGGVLGDVEATVVASAFGYFNPTLVEHMWNSAKQVMAPRQAAREFMACSAELGRRRFGDIDGLDAFCEAAQAVKDAVDPTALALYAGYAEEPLVDDGPGRAMQLTTVLREFRGSAHLLAVRAAGLDAKTAHFMTRPTDGGMFGWSDDEVPVVGDAERQKMAAADALTDQLVLPAYAVLDDAGQRALLDGLAAMQAALAEP